MKLTTYIHLVPRLRVCGAMHPLPHASSWCSAWLSTGTYVLILYLPAMPRPHMCLYPSIFTTKILCLSSLMCATCYASLILLVLIRLIIFGDMYKLSSSPLCTLLHPPFTYSFLSLYILLSTCSQACSVHVLPLVWKTKFHTHTKEKLKL